MNVKELRKPPQKVLPSEGDEHHQIGTWLTKCRGSFQDHFDTLESFETEFNIMEKHVRCLLRDHDALRSLFGNTTQVDLDGYNHGTPSGSVRSVPDTYQSSDTEAIASEPYTDALEVDSVDFDCDGGFFMATPPKKVSALPSRFSTDTQVDTFDMDCDAGLSSSRPVMVKVKSLPRKLDCPVEDTAHVDEMPARASLDTSISPRSSSLLCTLPEDVINDRSSRPHRDSNFSDRISNRCPTDRTPSLHLPETMEPIPSGESEKSTPSRPKSRVSFEPIDVIDVRHDRRSSAQGRAKGSLTILPERLSASSVTASYVSGGTDSSATSPAPDSAEVIPHHTRTTRTGNFTAPKLNAPRLQINYEVHPKLLAASSTPKQLQHSQEMPKLTRLAEHRWQQAVQNMGIHGDTGDSSSGDSAARRTKFQRRLERFMLDPTDARSVVFDFVLVALLIYDCVMIPLLVFDLPEMLLLTLISWISRVIWTLAIPRGFITGYMKSDGTPEMSPRLVMKKYVQGWFWFDFFVVLFDWVAVHEVGEVIRVLKTQRLFRFLRAVRLARVIRAPIMLMGRITETTSQIGVLWVGMFLNTAFFIFVVHWLACIWYALGYQYSRAVGISSTWLQRVNLSHEDSFLKRYSHSVHWAIGNFNDGGTIVYAESDIERLFAVITMVFSFIWSASFVSKITASLTRLQILSSKQGIQFNQLRNFLHTNNIHGPLAYRVTTCAKHLVREKSMHQHENDVELLKILSEHLLIEIHYEIHCHVVIIHPFFRSYNLSEPLPMQRLCHSGVEKTYLAMGDVLFVEGQDPEDAKMFFPTEGSLYYYKSMHSAFDDSSNFFSAIEPETWLCEQVLWTKWTHVGTARAGAHCQVMRLSAQVFHRVVAEYQQGLYTTSYAQRFVRALNEAIITGEEVDDVSSCVDVRKLAQQVFPSLLKKGSQKFLGRSSHSRSINSHVASDIAVTWHVPSTWNRTISFVTFVNRVKSLAASSRS